MTEEQGKTILHEMFDHETGAIIQDLIIRNAPAPERVKSALSQFTKRLKAVKPDGLAAEDFATLISCWLQIHSDAFKHFRAELGQLTVQE